MSFRNENEDSENDNSSSSRLGLELDADAVVGFGIGAALNSFINKRTETPTAKGSTTRGWTCTTTDTLMKPDLRMKPEDSLHNSNDSSITMSEPTTTDTSMFQDSSRKCSDNDFNGDISGEENSSCKTVTSQSDTEDSRSTDETDSEIADSNVTMDADISDSHDPYISTMDTDSSDFHNSDVSDPSDLSDVAASLHSPSYEFPRPKNYVNNYARISFKSRPKNKSRKRSRTHEQCLICFEVILRSHVIVGLPCNHNFHMKCILPSLLEQQTRPNFQTDSD